MVDRNRPPPTAEELAELNEAFRRDPARAAAYLGEALLALGRPREAVEVGARGLKVDPSNLPARLMVARAFAQLHQWKEAQAELLKIVKADKNHAPGFRLLGEVLLRRADHERALPVLQHAQNLDPADPSILTLLRRARSGQPLDPPPPIPTPMSPIAGGQARFSRQQAAAPQPVEYEQSYPIDDSSTNIPTKVAGEIDSADHNWGDVSPLGRVRLDKVEVRGAGPRAPLDAGVRRSDGRGMDDEHRRPVEHFAPPPTEDVFAPIGMDPYAGDPRGRMPLRSSGPHPQPGYPGAMGMDPGMHGPGPASTIPPGVRPRVVPVEKPRDAAQASLRQSAAVGEHYLNNLLLGGLLDVPRVRVPEAHYDLSPGRRWGRSTMRMFIYLFVLLFMGIGGAGAWYFYAEKQKSEDVERHIKGALALIDAGEYDSLARADTETRAAIERDRDNTFAVALLAQITAMEVFLYGELNPGEVANAIDLAAQDIKGPADEGYRELVLARAAHALAVLPTMQEGADARLAEVKKQLEGWLEKHGEDGLARWMYGHALWAGGDRKGAETAFEQADKGGEGPVVATISLADMRLDNGRYDDARALYERALTRSKNHPWAYIGHSLALSERSVDIDKAVADLNVGIPSKRGPRVDGWKHLAMATALLSQEDYKSFAAELAQAEGVSDPRFLVRVALLKAQQGKLADAAVARADIKWYADKPQPDPLVGILDAEIRLASGLARDAYAGVEKVEGLRASRLRGRALFDLGKAREAREELGEALKIAPKDLELQAWAEAAHFLSSEGDERKKADEALDSLGRNAKSNAVRVPHGIALAVAGRGSAAREKLERSLKDVSDEYPNALAYRAHVAIAELDLAEGKAPSAIEHVKKALEVNPGYLPAHDLLGRLLIDTAPNEALPHLIEVVRAEVATVGAELAFARAVMPSDKAEDRKAAADALRRAKQKGATPEQLALVVPLVDPGLAPELGLDLDKKKKRR
ncbi:MAG TPA: tetratricopeptide repeat protein [Kofleriaceae bacterium]|nr:tetratricopeptide repeat protein [Kofleriaceae bacterium]